jgi:hypothetical protein
VKVETTNMSDSITCCSFHMKCTLPNASQAWACERGWGFYKCLKGISRLDIPVCPKCASLHQYVESLTTFPRIPLLMT